jgi:hypothetical protein
MKKSFPLQSPGKDDARVRDKIRHEVNKYVRRCRQKEVPEGFAQWEFICKAGIDAAAAETKSLKEIATAIDTIASTGANSIYLEIEPVPAQRRSG